MNKKKKKKGFECSFCAGKPQPLLGASQRAIGNVAVDWLWANPIPLRNVVCAFPCAARRLCPPCAGCPPGATGLRTKICMGADEVVLERNSLQAENGCLEVAGDTSWVAIAHPAEHPPGLSEQAQRFAESCSLQLSSPGAAWSEAGTGREGCCLGSRREERC